MVPQNRLPVLMTPGVIQIVGVGKSPIPVDEEEIAAIQRVVKNGLSPMPWPYLQVGRVARIEEGPLRGMTGVIVRIKSGMTRVLSPSLLQRSGAGGCGIRRATTRPPARPKACPGFVGGRTQS